MYDLKIFGACFGVVFVLFIIWIIATARKSKRLDAVINAISERPCEETAKAALNEFTNMNVFVRFNLSNGSDTRGVHFTMWREVFNYTVIPCTSIKTETKEALRKALIRLNTHSLKPVVAVQTADESKAAAEAFGKGGEENVWHNLKAILDCDVYRNVKIINGDTTSEIDAILVSESKGIFLFEVKSVGGITASDGSKIVAYNMLKEDPSNQIYRHEYDFVKCFENIDVSNKIKNVLVFSWPYGDTRRCVANSSFPQTDYSIITVEQLITFLKVQPSVTISQQERNVIAAKLKGCSRECSIK